MNVFKKAHELTKKIIKAGDNYRATFRLCLVFVYSQIKKGVNKMVELIGSEKQIAWAGDIRDEKIKSIDVLLGKVLEPVTDSEKLSRNHVRRALGINKKQVGGTKEAVTEALELKLKDIKNQLSNIEDVNFFINNRFKRFEELSEMYIENDGKLI